jgi:hydroxyacylglutathione hydrolase
MFLRQITDSSLAQNAYLIGCQRSGEAIIVDPERDIDRYLSVAAENDLRITAVAETHIHADYLSGAPTSPRKVVPTGSSNGRREIRMSGF